MKRLLAIAVLVTGCLNFATSASAEEKVAAEQIIPAVKQLRHAVGDWNVETDFINEKGDVYTAKGTYSFEWVVPDKRQRHNDHSGVQAAQSCSSTGQGTRKLRWLRLVLHGQLMADDRTGG